MKDKNLALGLVDFVGDVPGFWEEVKEIAETKLAVIGKRAQQLKKDVFATKDVFLNTIIDMVFILKKTPAFFQPIVRWVLKGIIKLLLDKLDKEWFANIQKKLGLIKIANAKVTVSDV